MTEYERVRGQIGKIIFYGGVEDSLPIPQWDNIIEEILSIKGICIKADDQSWDCAGKVFVVGMNPSSFVELLEGKGFVKVVNNAK